MSVPYTSARCAWTSPVGRVRVDGEVVALDLTVSEPAAGDLPPRLGRRRGGAIRSGTDGTHRNVQDPVAGLGGASEQVHVREV
jgi:hypothetical protein